MKLPTVLATRFYVMACVLSFIFVFLAAVIATWRISTNALTLHTTLSVKASVIFQILMSHWMPHDLFGEVLFWVTALLTGINLALVIEVILQLERVGKTTWSVGGIGMLALVNSGCTSCGFSLIALLGSSAGATFFVTHNTDIMFLSTLLLCITAAYNIHKLQKGIVCNVP